MNQKVDARPRVAAGQTKQERSGITRGRLIAATEKLVAEWGIEAVNLRDVGREAEQHNNSVVQYHFGTKEFLVDSVISGRLPALAERYAALAAKTNVTKKDPAGTARLLVGPIAELAEVDTDKAFVGFLSSILTSAHWRPLLEDRSELAEIFDVIATAIAATGVDPDKAASRVRLAWELAVVTLAGERGEADDVVAEVVDAITGIVATR